MRTGLGFVAIFAFMSRKYTLKYNIFSSILYRDSGSGQLSARKEKFVHHRDFQKILHIE
jgi:hypothetical protein